FAYLTRERASPNARLSHARRETAHGSGLMPQAIVTYSAPFEPLVLLELRRSGARLTEPLAPGVGVIDFPYPYEQLGEGWRRRPPVYLRHCVPLLQRLPRRDLKRAVRALAPGLPRNLPVQVQVRPLAGLPEPCRRELESDLERLVRSITGIPLEPRRPGQVVHAILTDAEALVGAAPVRWTLSPWNGGVPEFWRDPWRLNRAEHKLQEALETFRLRLPEGGRCLDLGASPGGWSRIVLAYGMQVTAVDPHPRGLAPCVLHRVDYRPVPAQKFLKDYRGEPFDLLLNDMYLPARASAWLTVACAGLLRDGAAGLVTLKLGKASRHHSLVRAVRILRTAYSIPRMRQLHYNRAEVTLWL
ncbi:MAG: SAM-dependent methyltransferase, partial [Candidatus Eremiobacterota bacterium]